VVVEEHAADRLPFTQTGLTPENHLNKADGMRRLHRLPSKPVRSTRLDVLLLMEPVYSLVSA